jgi:glutaredoxin
VTADPESADIHQRLPNTPGDGETFHPKLVEGGVRVIGERWSPQVHEIKALLARSRAPYRWIDVDHDEGARAIAAQAGAEKRPVVLFSGGSVLADPDIRCPASLRLAERSN